MVLGGFDGFLAGIRVLSKVGTFLAHKREAEPKKRAKKLLSREGVFLITATNAPVEVCEGRPDLSSEMQN